MLKLSGIFLALALLLTACDGEQGANIGAAGKIGVVDVNRLMRDSVPGKAGLKYIESQQTELQSALDALQDKLEKNPKDNAAAEELQKTYISSQQKIQSEGQAVLAKLLEAIQVVLDEYRQKNGYMMLIRIEALDSYDKSIDITNAIMSEVDKIKMEFEPARPAADTSAEKKDPPASDQAASAATPAK